MKTRNGFVSNSSSSSFIIRFEKNKDLRTQVEEMLDSVIDVFDIEDETEYFDTMGELEKDFDDEDEKQEAYKRVYKEHVINDLMEALESGKLDRNLIQEDLDKLPRNHKIESNQTNLYHYYSLMHYVWGEGGKYEYNYWLAKNIIEDNDNEYYKLWVSDHWNEDANYDGYLENWLKYDNNYVVNTEDGH